MRSGLRVLEAERRLSGSPLPGNRQTETLRGEPHETGDLKHWWEKRLRLHLFSVRIFVLKSGLTRSYILSLEGLEIRKAWYAHL